MVTYRHYKGGTYTLTGVAHESTNARKPAEGKPPTLVAQYVGHQSQRAHVRDLEEFVEPVEWPDGVIRPRFTEERIGEPRPWSKDPKAFFAIYWERGKQPCE